MNSLLRKLLYAIGASALLLLFFLALYLPVQPRGQVLADEWEMQFGDMWLPVEFPLRRMITELETATLSRQVRYQPGDALVLTWPRGQALEVRLDGKPIYATGDPAAPSANLWNQAWLVQLPAPNPQGNILAIDLTSAAFPINLPVAPYLLPLQEAGPRVALTYFLYNDLLLIANGAAFVLGGMLVLLGCLQRKNGKAFIFLGVASILGCLNSMDYVFRVSTGSLASFLIFKKATMTAGYLGIISFVFGLEQYFCGRSRYSRLLAGPSLAAIAVVLFQPDMIRLASATPLLNLVILADILAAILLILTSSHGRDWAVIPAIWLALGVAQTIVLQVFNLDWPFLLPYILLMSTILFSLHLLADFRQIFAEKEDLEKRIDLDSLTSAYNRNVLDKAPAQDYDALVLMDLDHFKAYNDKYGHQQGDQALIDFTRIVQQNLRPQDMVVRYGGDEFLLLLSQISLLDAESVAARIRKDFETQSGNEELSVSYGIEKLDYSYSSGVKEADRLMYAMKQAKELPRKLQHKKNEED